METTLIITDLTRMSGARVCIAGVTPEKRCIRPVFENGKITENWLYQNGQVVIRPFARVLIDTLRAYPQSPHTEDWIIRPDFKQILGTLTEDEKQSFLEEILDPGVENIFGAPVHSDHGYFLREGEGNRSLGTIRVKQMLSVTHRYHPQEDKWDYRIEFVDENGCAFNLSVTDLAFRYYVDHLRIQQGLSCNHIGGQLVQQLHYSQAVYLRIGLTRPTWQKWPHCCFLQINGVYSFPDYLKGRCFADFASQPSKSSSRVLI